MFGIIAWCCCWLPQRQPCQAHILQERISAERQGRRQTSHLQIRFCLSCQSAESIHIRTLDRHPQRAFIRLSYGTFYRSRACCAIDRYQNQACFPDWRCIRTKKMQQYGSKFVVCCRVHIFYISKESRQHLLCTLPFGSARAYGIQSCAFDNHFQALDSRLQQTCKGIWTMGCIHKAAGLAGQAFQPTFSAVPAMLSAQHLMWH